MKKLLFILSVMVLASCGQHKKEIARMQAKQDSIQLVEAQKDNSIIELMDGMNEIQMNLDSIRTLEKIVSVQTSGGTEVRADSKKRIMENITEIYTLLKRNKELSQALQGKLNRSNLKIAQLEKMISLLNKQVGEKDEEISRLNQELQKLHIDVAGLNQKIDSISSESERNIQAKVLTIEEQTIAMNTAFYAFGTKKELDENNVIEKEGGFLGLGKTIKMKKDFNRDYFMKIDIRQFMQLPLNTKKAKLVTYHPEGSYHFTGVKTVESLVIDKPAEFWKASKYMLIVVE